MPKSWTNYKIHYRYRQTVYHITITRRDTEDATQLLLDGKVLAAKTVPLVDDRQEHFVVMNVANA
jgi:cellobiose phosphorylase